MRWAEHWLQRLASASAKRPITTIVIVALVALTSGVGIPKVRLRLDARSLIPADAPEFVTSDRAAARFRTGDVVVVGVTVDENTIFHPLHLSAVHRLHHALARVPEIDPSSVQSLASLDTITVQDDSVLDVRPVSPPEAAQSDAVAAGTRKRVHDLRLDDGVFVARDHRAVAIFAHVRPNADRYALLQRVLDLKSRESHGGRDVVIGGNGLVQAALGRQAAADLVKLLPLVIVLLFTLLAVIYRSATIPVLCLAEVGVALTITFGVMGHLAEPIFVTTLILPVIVLCIGVSDDIYGIDASLRQGATTNPVAGGMAHVAGPILATTVTTCTGLAVLAVSGLQPLRVFGIYGALSIATSTLLTFTLVPALASLLRIGERVQRDRVARRRLQFGAQIARWATSVPKSAFIWLAVPLGCVAAYFALQLRINDSWVANLRPTSVLAQDAATLNKRLAGATMLDLQVDSGTRDGFLDPALFDRAREHGDRLRRMLSVGAVASVADHVSRVRAGLLGLSVAELDRRHRRPDHFDIHQSLVLLSNSRGVRLDDWIDESYRYTRLRVFVKAADYESLRPIFRAAFATPTLSAKADAVVPFGDAWAGQVSVQRLVHGEAISIALAFLFDLLLLWVLFKRWSLALVGIAPAAISVLAVSASLGAAGMSVGIAASMFASIALGVGVDFSVHLVAAWLGLCRSQQGARDAVCAAVSRTAPAIVTTSATLACSLLVLVFSAVPPNRMLGLLTGFCLAVAGAATLALGPRLLLIAARER